MTSVHDFGRFKAAGRRISMVAAYEAWSAAVIARSQVDAILVGDSAAMVLHGYPTTLSATFRGLKVSPVHLDLRSGRPGLQRSPI